MNEPESQTTDPSSSLKTTWEEVEGQEAFTAGKPCFAPERFDRERQRALWRLGWKRAAAAAGFVSPCDDTGVMELWRECGLPDYFLGNGGTNHKLVDFARRCREMALPRSAICGGTVDLSNAIKPAVSFGGKRDVSGK